MTDEAKALVERLRDRVVYDSRHYIPDPLLSAGADIIETQAREIERLNAILSEMNDTDVIARAMAENERLRSVVEKYAIDLCEMGGSHELCGLLSEVECGGCFARAALAGDSHV